MEKELTMIEQVEREALFFASTDDESEREALRRLCRVAADGLEARLRPGLKPEDCSSFALAAAMKAICFFEAGKSAGEVSSFSIGELSVSAAGKNAALQALAMQAAILVAPYLDGGPVLVGTRG